MGDELIDDIFGEDDPYEEEDVRSENEEPTGNVEEENKFKEEKIPIRIKRTLKPRVTFNADRLCGPRGIPILVNHFKDVKFKGKDHLVEDLDLLMLSLEHWAHRLYPPFKFSDMLKEMERLGKRRSVQVCLQKIRMDMPILNEEFVAQQEDDADKPPENDFDRLVADYYPANNDDADDDGIEHSEVSVPSTSSRENTITGEQKERMERNRLLAIERLKARRAAESALAEQPESRLDDDEGASTSKNSEAPIENSLNNELDDNNDAVSPGFIPQSERKSKVIDSSEDDSDADDSVILSKPNGNRVSMEDDEEFPTLGSVDYSNLSIGERIPNAKKNIANQDPDSDTEVVQNPKKRKNISSDSEEESDELSSSKPRRNTSANDVESISMQRPKKRQKIISDSDDSDMDEPISIKPPKKASIDDGETRQSHVEMTQTDDTTFVDVSKNPKKRRNVISDSDEDDSDVDIQISSPLNSPAKDIGLLLKMDDDESNHFSDREEELIIDEKQSDLNSNNLNCETAVKSIDELNEGQISSNLKKDDSLMKNAVDLPEENRDEATGFTLNEIEELFSD